MSFRSDSTHLTVGGAQLIRISPKIDHPILKNLFGIILNELLLIRSEAIDSTQKCNEFLQFVDQTESHQPLRLSSLQLNTLSREWHLIQLQHQLFVRATQNLQNSKKIAHLCLPTFPFYFKLTSREQSEFQQKAFHKLLQQFNSEAWSIYCEWIGEEIEQVLGTFKPEASEEYQLQAHLEDFRHEVHSPILFELKKEIQTAILEEQEALEKRNKELVFSIATILAEKRNKLLFLMNIQLELLNIIEKDIQKIEDIHSELHDLKVKIVILNILLRDFLGLKGFLLNWGQKLLLLQLLDQKLKVTPAINCNTGVERTNFIFAIRLALAELFREFHEEKILGLCLMWGEKNEDKEEERLLKLRVLANCQLLNIKNENKNIENHENSENVQVNRDFLRFLPNSTLISGEIKTKVVTLLTLNESGRPLGLTKEGEQFLKGLGMF